MTPNQESFLKDVSKHSMTALLDNGVYRHLSFSNNGSFNQRFDIVTWPGFLAYSGDMGCFVFSRLADMFEFFRVRPQNEHPDTLHINTGYWAEKLQAVDHCGSQASSAKGFSLEKFECVVNEHVATWIEDCGLNDESAEALRAMVSDEVLCAQDEGEYAAHEALRDFSCEIDGHKFEFADTWEWDLTEYTYRFIWCCYAIAWGIKQYDETKRVQP